MFENYCRSSSQYNIGNWKGMNTKINNNIILLKI